MAWYYPITSIAVAVPKFDGRRRQMKSEMRGSVKKHFLVISS